MKLKQLPVDGTKLLYLRKKTAHFRTAAPYNGVKY